jgi:hypothetical protein
MWFELPDELLVVLDAVDPEAPVSVCDVPLRAMARPAAGSPRRPARIRVADKDLAAELRTTLSEIEVVVAPTPELGALAEERARSMPDGEESASYVEGGRVSEGAVKALFEAAARLYEITPWKIAHESQILRLDIPQFGVEGASSRSSVSSGRASASSSSPRWSPTKGSCAPRRGCLRVRPKGLSISGPPPWCSTSSPLRSCRVRCGARQRAAAGRSPQRAPPLASCTAIATACLARGTSGTCAS